MILTVDESKNPYEICPSLFELRPRRPPEEEG